MIPTRPNERATGHRTNRPSQPSRTYPLLSELTGALVLSVSQEFDDTALIGGKTDNLAGDLTDEGSAAGRLALGAADLGLGGVEGCGFLEREDPVSFGSETPVVCSC